MSAEEDLPEGPTSPADEPGLPPGNFELPPTPLEVVIPLIRDLELSQIETKKWFLRQFTQMLRDHNQMMQQQMSFQQQLTAISRRCQILQDWMMSPVRMVPLQVLQDNTLNIDQLQDAISQTPSDNDPWSVQLLELLDQSIAAHFPHFDFPHWDLLNPEIPPSSPENPSEEQEVFSTPDYKLPVPEEQEEHKSAPEYVPYTFQRRVTEDGIPSPSPPPFQDDDEIPSPSPPLEQVPSQDAYYPANTQQQDGEEVIPSPILDPSLNAVGSGDTFEQDLENELEQVLEVTDGSPDFTNPRKNRRKQTWQSVPSSDIAHSELPVPLDPASKRNPRSRRRKNSVSPTDDKSSKKKKRDPWYTWWSWNASTNSVFIKRRLQCGRYLEFLIKVLQWLLRSTVLGSHKTSCLLYITVTSACTWIWHPFPTAHMYFN